jgi:hypothetical protein
LRGIVAFENCAVPWTATYDEILFIKEGASEATVFPTAPAGAAGTGSGGFRLDQNRRL